MRKPEREFLRTVIMKKTDELKKLAKKFSDRSRKTLPAGHRAIVPHKFKPSGAVISNENFDAKCDLSHLTLSDLRFLDAWKDCGWNFEKACEKLDLDVEQAKRSYAKVRYFEFEDKKTQALSKVPTPEFVAAKNLEGFYQDNLSDGQRDHLKELAKITGAYKPTQSIHVQVQLEKPAWTPEQEAKMKAFYDTIAIEAPHAA